MFNVNTPKEKLIEALIFTRDKYYAEGVEFCSENLPHTNKKVFDQKDLLLLCQHFRDDPLGFVMVGLDWKNNTEIQKAKLSEPYRDRYKHIAEYGPAQWQCEFLDDWGKHLKANPFDTKNPTKYPQPQPFNYGVASGRGIGKTALMCWIILYVMSTRKKAMGRIASGKFDQLRLTWSQLSTWRDCCMTKDWFIYTNNSNSLELKHVLFPENWIFKGVAAEGGSNAHKMAGLHNSSSMKIYLFDEASEIPNDVFTTVRGSQGSGGEDALIAFGNPVQPNGYFREMFRNYKDSFYTKQINALDVETTNKPNLLKMKEEWERDGDLRSIDVHILGKFPDVSASQFIPNTMLEECQKRTLDHMVNQNAPTIIGLDPAGTGEDKTAIVLRQGFMCKVLYTEAKTENFNLLCERVLHYQHQYNANFVAYDNGGLGYGVKTWVQANLRLTNRTWKGVLFQEQSGKEGLADKKMYIYWKLKEWIRDGGVITDTTIIKELETLEYYINDKGNTRLIGKSEMKAKGLKSPDIADALALTFDTQVDIPLKNNKEYYKDINHLDLDISSALSTLNFN
jgi:hypothetical protein